MQLSILIPTHRNDLLACSRIAQACSWAGPKLEVIVRDNSGNAEKRNLLAQFKRDHCNIVFSEPCEPLVNFSEILRLAKGEFVFFLADDDFGFDRAITALPGKIDEIVNDRSIAAITGAYVIEASSGSSVVGYQSLDSNDVTARIAGYLNFEGANVLIYSPIRRELVQRIFAFMNFMPFSFSFHDQIVCLLYLLNGKFIGLKRLLYLYDIGDWEMAQTAQARDVKFYTSSNVDPAINKLHWFLCGFEGAVLIRNADIFPDYPMAQRQIMADRWFSMMFIRFTKNPRATFGSRFSADADRFCEKWKASAGRLSFQEMLADVCGFISLFSKDNSQKYFEFWNAILTRTKVAGRST
jgi:hypothetical protein